jgi:site-specific DNA-methyltransferase (adenine-specific)
MESWIKTLGISSSPRCSISKVKGMIKVKGMMKMKGKLYFQARNIWIYNDDFLTTDRINEGSVDLIVTSPPYNVDIKYNSYDDTIPYDIYLEFTQKWLEKAYKLLKDDGRLCLNIPLDKNKGGQQSVYADIVTIAKK